MVLFSELLESSNSRYIALDTEWVGDGKVALLSMYHNIKNSDHALLIRLNKIETSQIPDTLKVRVFSEMVFSKGKKIYNSNSFVLAISI